MMFESNTPVEEWAERYQISLEPIECNECKAPLEFSTPLVFKNYRGLATLPCNKCGHSQGAFRAVPIGKEKEGLWKTLFEAFKEHPHNDK